MTNNRNRTAGIRQRLRRVSSWTTCALLTAAMLAPAAHAAGMNVAGTCQQMTIPVGLSETDPGTPYEISGTLCEPRTFSGEQPSVDVLVHGITYTRQYWDWQQEPDTYSFVDKDLRAGRATFAYDRLGDGASDSPLSTNLTLKSDAYNLHEIIQIMRSRYPQVNVIGHSWGSGVAVDEANTYNDGSRLIATGLLHSMGPGMQTLYADLVPTGLDGYVTTRAGTRQYLFYDTQGPQPAAREVIAHDEQTKDVTSASQLSAGAAQHFLFPPSLNFDTNITRPVMLVVGDEDRIFCPGLALYGKPTLDCHNASAVRAEELPFYSTAAKFDTVVIPNTGHDLTLHPTAELSFAEINTWINSTNPAPSSNGGHATHLS